MVKETELPIDADWDYRGIVNGHNNFIDAGLFLGVPAAAFVLFLFIVRPFFHYVRATRDPAQVRQADLFLMIAVFCMVDSLLESFWFRRGDPIWISNFIAVFGLRYLALMPYRR